MATVRFYGDLRRYGDRFKLHVSDTKEAIRLLCAQIPGLKDHINKGHYRVRVNREDVSEKDIDLGLSYRLHENSIIHLVPVVFGAKDSNLISGLINVVVGAVLIVSAFYTGGATAYAYAASGAAMVLGGVALLLTPMPEMKPESGSKESTSFSNLDNLAPQGRPVPLIYGEMMVGSLVISQGLETVDVEV